MARKIEISPCLAVFAWILFAGSSVVLGQKVLTPVEQACRFLDQGDIGKAEKLLERESKTSPHTFDAHLYLGIAHYFKRDFESAFHIFADIETEVDRMAGSGRALVDKPTDANMRDIAVMNQQWNERKADLLLSKELRGLLYFCRGLTLKQKNDLKNAENRFKKALNHKYEAEAVHLQLLDINIMQNDTKAAFKSFSELSNTSRDNETLFCFDGQLSFLKGNLEESLAGFEKMSPGSLDARKNVARLRYDLGEYRRAIEVWKEILSVHPDDREAQLNIGRAYFHLGDSAKAQEHFDNAGLTLKPEHYSPKQIPPVSSCLQNQAKMIDLQCK